MQGNEKAELKRRTVEMLESTIRTRRLAARQYRDDPKGYAKEWYRAAGAVDGVKRVLETVFDTPRGEVETLEEVLRRQIDDGNDGP
ncbi:MAG: hypothetical protein Q4C60_12200 [Eubacteriales bacterium]|nr:hypothetical protein [Eubacteriales bacterium]